MLDVWCGALPPGGRSTCQCIDNFEIIETVGALGRRRWRPVLDWPYNRGTTHLHLHYRYHDTIYS